MVQRFTIRVDSGIWHLLVESPQFVTVPVYSSRGSVYFVKRYFRLESVEFVLADLRSVEFTRFGRFDVVFNSGVLYHLDAPWDLLQRLEKVAQRMLL
jgi:hypothetical protein